MGLAGGAARCSPLCPPACPEGLYGENCQHSCLCQHGGSCDPVSGQCTCPEGRTGLACERGEHWARRAERRPRGALREAGLACQRAAVQAPPSVVTGGSLVGGRREQHPGVWLQACRVTSTLPVLPEDVGSEALGAGSTGQAGSAGSWAYSWEVGPHPLPARQSASPATLEPAASTAADVSTVASVTGTRATASV